MPQAVDGGWGEDWSEDVEPTYEAPPPAGLTEFDLALYRRIVGHLGRAGSIPKQETLAEEMGLKAKHRVRTVKRSIARLKAARWLNSDRRTRRGYRGGGQLLASNRYFPKVSLNDLPEAAFPQVRPRGQSITAGRTEGTAPAGPVDSPTEGTPEGVASRQVRPRGQEPSCPLGDGGEAEETRRSDRGAKPVDNPPNTPTVSESKPVLEGVSSQVEVELSSAAGRPSFRTMAEEKAWVAARARLPPEVDDDMVWVLVKLQEAGMLETARVLKVERRG